MNKFYFTFSVGWVSPSKDGYVVVLANDKSEAEKEFHRMYPRKIHSVGDISHSVGDISHSVGDISHTNYSLMYTEDEWMSSEDCESYRNEEPCAVLDVNAYKKEKAVWMEMYKAHYWDEPDEIAEELWNQRHLHESVTILHDINRGLAENIWDNNSCWNYQDLIQAFPGLAGYVDPNRHAGRHQPDFDDDTTCMGIHYETSGAPLSANEYQELAMRTNDGKMTERMMNPIDMKEGWDIGGIFEGCLGLSGESGEMVDLIKKWVFHRKPLDETHAKKELGDVLWYAALICHSFGWKMEEIMNLNIEKLKQRYPDGFTPEAANNRKEGDI